MNKTVQKPMLGAFLLGGRVKPGVPIQGVTQDVEPAFPLHFLELRFACVSG